VNIYSVLDAAFSAVFPAAQAKGIQVFLTLEHTIGALAGDPERLQQIFWNLLANAIKFTPEGGRVEVRLSRIGRQIQIAVIDNGCGIRAEFLPFVFDRLRQGESSLPESRRGLGLGLAIVRHLVELHGGTVAASSDGVGKGATFTVTIPCRRLEAATEQSPNSSREKPRRPEVTTRPGPCLSGVRALVIDDEPDARQVVSLMLERAGAQVTSAGSAAEGLDAFSHNPPDVLLCDIGLPDEDGYQVITKVRKIPADQGGRVPAIALTAYAGGEDRRRALTAGFQLHIPKPGPANLATIIAGLVGRTVGSRVSSLGRPS
jgi:CheY-like chemotaxis protein